MRTLKLLVIGMGIVIVVATAVLITVIVQRAGKIVTAQPATNQPVVAVADKAISVPDGFHVVSSELSGDRLLVRLDGHGANGQGEIRFVVIDLAHGDAQHIVRLTLPGQGP
jgi:hypothetical protein